MILTSIVKVHRAKLGLTIYCVAALSASLVGSYAISRLGINILLSPVSPALLLGIVAGLGVVIALSGLEHVDRPRNLRRYVSDTLYFVVVNAVMISSYLVIVTVLDFENVSGISVVRNFFLTIALALPSVSLGRTEHSWLLPFGVTLFATQFGRGSDGISYPWWAIMIDPMGSPTQLLASFLLFVVAGFIYIAEPNFLQRCKTKTH